jgi:hypothetical protein
MSNAYLVRKSQKEKKDNDDFVAFDWVSGKDSVRITDTIFSKAPVLKAK